MLCSDPLILEIILRLGVLGRTSSSQGPSVDLHHRDHHSAVYVSNRHATSPSMSAIKVLVTITGRENENIITGKCHFHLQQSLHHRHQRSL